MITDIVPAFSCRSGVSFRSFFPVISAFLSSLAGYSLAFRSLQFKKFKKGRQTEQFSAFVKNRLLIFL
jgi:hypothetical protein